ncbi:MAG TPA: hypothetical protein VEK08_10055 [Planctomycetota bacterium]|nr:hypothetical protein [Planctomycetota bacterium]
MEKLVLGEKPTQMEEIVDRVCKSNKPVTVEKANGDAVTVIPVPKPIGYRKGVPIYRTEDLQFLYLDYPHLFE